ncbi:hypothetical protein [Sneathiella litorea]|uniref:Uncharacterized protein n=1 Tax=Sneathiella litorea TaxID=2606216 RepID=A0A6L8W8K0_9PROT|nr:hypothetical protein [Sneathiella litorea]MZR31458.1 hypothetical protein [Sneathiella litorea]
MQRPIEAIYQSIVPGISTITLRYRYYSFFPFILKHYEEHIRHPDPDTFRAFQRRCEALFALICTHGEPELGITGSDWAGRTLNDARAQSNETAIIDFSIGADPDADDSLRYLRNKGGAFGAIYATQMSEMGLIHFPEAGDPNPNPVCSDAALKLADALSRELGATADEFFEVVAAGKVALSSLESFEAMKPNRLRRGSGEHILLTDILLGKSDTRSETDLMRRSTLQMLLDVTAALRSIPRAEQVKWYWFENVPELQDGNAHEVPHLWFLYQACDLMRLAYEVILSAALTLLETAPRRRMSLSDLTDELVSFAEVVEDQTWENVSLGLADGSANAAREHALAMLDAMHEGETAEQVRLAVSLIAILFVRASDASKLIEEAISGADYFQSLRTEVQFLDRASSAPARLVVADMVRERVVKRHLWVASRKFRNQKAYTFHMEPEEGRLRYRNHFRVSPSSPRLDQAVRFLRDIGLIDEDGITQLGRAEMAAA